MIEGSGFPGCGGVTGTAARAKLAAMTVVLRVTGVAVRGRTFEPLILVTAGAGNSDMRAGQLEDGMGMVKGAGFPAAGGVAGGAV